MRCQLSRMSLCFTYSLLINIWSDHNNFTEPTQIVENLFYACDSGNIKKRRLVQGWKNVVSGNGVQGTLMGKCRYLWLPASGLTKCGTFYTYSQLHRSRSYLDYQCSPVVGNLTFQGLQSFLSQKPQRQQNEMAPGAALKNTAFEISESQLKFFKCNFGIILI